MINEPLIVKNKFDENQRTFRLVNDMSFHITEILYLPSNIKEETYIQVLKGSEVIRASEWNWHCYPDFNEGVNKTYVILRAVFYIEKTGMRMFLDQPYLEMAPEQLMFD